MGNEKFKKLCKCMVVRYVNERLESEREYIAKEDVCIVWLCKVLQNNKALVSTNLSDGMYYEITYNGDKDEIYFDAYKKAENICYKPCEFENGTVK